MSSTTGRKRVTERHYSAEEQALDQISKEAEARIQARRAARAEAREIRLREIAKQQKEEEERLKTQEADSGKSLSSYSGSRRGSDESTSTDTDLRDKDPKDAVRQYKSMLRDYEEKYKKAMSTNAQLDNQKHTLVYQVELLKDQLEEQEESMIEVQRQYKDKCREFENQKRSFIDLEFQYNGLKEQMSYRDRFLQESGFTVVSTEEGMLKLEKCSTMTNGPIIPQGSLLVSDEAAEMLAKAGEGSLGISDKNGSMSVSERSDLCSNSHPHDAGTRDYERNLLEQGSHETEKEISRETIDKTQVAEHDKIEFKDHNEVHTFEGDGTKVMSLNGVSEFGNEGRDGFEKNDVREINVGVGKEDKLVKEVDNEEDGNVEEELEKINVDEIDGRKEEKMEEDVSKQKENEIVDKCKNELVDKSKQDVPVVFVKKEEKEVADDDVFEDAAEELGECQHVDQIVQDSTTQKEAIIREEEYSLDEQPIFSSVSSEVVITFKDEDGDSKEVEVAGQTDGCREYGQEMNKRQEVIDQEQVNTFVGNEREDEMDIGYETKMVDKDDETIGGGCELIAAEVNEMVDEDHKLDVIYQKNSINDDQACEGCEDIVVGRKQTEMVAASEQDVVVQEQVNGVACQGQENTMRKDGQVMADQELEDKVFGQIQEEKVVDNGPDVVGEEKKDEVFGQMQEEKVVDNGPDVVGEEKKDEVFGQIQEEKVVDNGPDVVGQVQKDEVFGQIEEEKRVDYGPDELGQDKKDNIFGQIQEEKVIDNGPDVLGEDKKDDVLGQIQEEKVIDNGPDVLGEEKKDEVFGQIQEEKVIDNGPDVLGEDKKDEVLGQIQEEKVIDNGPDVLDEEKKDEVLGQIQEEKVIDNGPDVLGEEKKDEVFGQIQEEKVVDNGPDVLGEEKKDEVFGQIQEEKVVDNGLDVVGEEKKDEVFGQIEEEKKVDYGPDELGQDKKDNIFGQIQEEKVIDNGPNVGDQGKKDEVFGQIQDQNGKEFRLHNDWQDQQTEDKVVSQEQVLQTVGSKVEDVESSVEVSQEEVLGTKSSSGGSMEAIQECAKELVHSVIDKAVLISQLDCQEKSCNFENGNLGDDCKMLGGIVENEFPDNQTFKENGLAGEGENESMVCSEDMSNISPYTKSESRISTAEHHLSCDIVESVTLCNANDPEISSSVVGEEGGRTGKIDNPAPEEENIDSSQNKDVGFVSDALPLDRTHRDVLESEESSALSVSDNEASTQSLSEETSSQKDSTAISEAEAMTVESQIESNKEAADVSISKSETVTSGGQKGSKKEVITSSEDHELSKVKSEGAKLSKSQSESQEKKNHSKEMKHRKSKKKSKEEGGVDDKLRKFLEEKKRLLEEIKSLQKDIEDERSKKDKSPKVPQMNGPEMQLYEVQREASKQIHEYKLKLQKAEQDIGTYEATVNRLEQQIKRYKFDAEEAEKTEDELKTEKRRLQRELRDSQNQVEELQNQNKHLKKRLEKVKQTRSALLNFNE